MLIKGSTGNGRELVLIEREWRFINELLSLRIKDLKRLEHNLGRENDSAIGKSIAKEIDECIKVKTAFEKADRESTVAEFPLGTSGPPTPPRSKHPAEDCYRETRAARALSWADMPPIVSTPLTEMTGSAKEKRRRLRKASERRPGASGS